MKNETELKANQLSFKKLSNLEIAAYLAFEQACDAQLAANNLVSEKRAAFIEASEALRDLRMSIGF